MNFNEYLTAVTCGYNIVSPMAPQNFTLLLRLAPSTPPIAPLMSIAAILPTLPGPGSIRNARTDTSPAHTRKTAPAPIPSSSPFSRADMEDSSPPKNTAAQAARVVTTVTELLGRDSERQTKKAIADSSPRPAPAVMAVESIKALTHFITKDRKSVV